MESHLVLQQNESMAQTQASQAQPPQPGQLMGLEEQPLSVLHCLHSLAQMESQVVEQQ
jgi:hypothetical protein